MWDITSANEKLKALSDMEGNGMRFGLALVFDPDTMKVQVMVLMAAKNTAGPQAVITKEDWHDWPSAVDEAMEAFRAKFPDAFQE